LKQILHFEADTLTCKEPTIPIEFNKHPRKKPFALNIYCIHHQPTTMFNSTHIHRLQQILSTLNINNVAFKEAPATPKQIRINPSHSWTKLLPPPTPIIHTFIPPLPNYYLPHPPKFLPEFSYFTDGSFVPPKQDSDGFWIVETAGYSIYNSQKHIEIFKRLPGLQNILRVELIAIHHTLTLIQNQFSQEPTHTFTDSLNSFYLINTQLKHPSLHNNHPDKTILSTIASLLCSHTQSISLNKVRAHANILGNSKADTLAKAGNTLPHRPPISDFEHVHSTPYYLHKQWYFMCATPYNGPICHLQAYIIKSYRKYNLEPLATSFPSISKWTLIILLIMTSPITSRLIHTSQHLLPVAHRPYFLPHLCFVQHAPALHSQRSP
jgi:ribonuclease HI